ncbi:uncharacterized protein LOC142162444 [Nicotiana tabacum]|uniref:Uncharacterized protein LOC142162444 n=1 Tax=Nicotiana tabacum TaxID=4097 RepID=A0AC58RQ72_TOBAC
MALLNAMDKWRHYLQYKHFVVKTDHHNLKYLLEQRVTSVIQQKGLTKLLRLDYEVQYKKRAKNREIAHSYEGDTKATELISQAAMTLQGPNIWHYTSSILRRKKKIYICTSGGLKTQLISIFHDSLVGGHLGQLGTLKRLSLMFYWPRMK